MYSYMPLDIKGGELRLLEVLPDPNPGPDESLDDLVSCRLFHRYVNDTEFTFEYTDFLQQLPSGLSQQDVDSRWHDKWNALAESSGPDWGSKRARYNWANLFAVSYVWGYPNKQTTILLDGCEIFATANLEAFLRASRGKHALPHPELLWVDASCS